MKPAGGAAMLLSVRDLTTADGPHAVLWDITFSLGLRERAGLVGANGAGKTTLVRILAGQEAADSGMVAVSHDRWFLRRFGGEVREPAMGKLTVHPAGYVSTGAVEDAS
jgi:ATPase subunit of ABC transporter with duplicated ATPase domains